MIEPVKFLREDTVLLTVFQMMDLWQGGCRCPARVAGMPDGGTESEEQAQALVTGILIAPRCAVHDPEHADGGSPGGVLEGVLTAEFDGVQFLLPSFAGE